MDTDSAPANTLFRRIDASDAEAALSVIESAFARWPPFEVDASPLDHLRWKMTPPPPADPDQHAMIELDGVPVATQLRWMGVVDVRGERLPFDFGIDVAVTPAARGLGLASQLRDQETERRRSQPSVGFDTVSNSARVKDMYRSRGLIHRPLDVWRNAPDLRTFVGVHRGAGIRHLLQATFEAATHTRRTRTRGDLPARWRIDQITAFDEQATDLWESIRSAFQLARRRDADWLNWRYLDPRAGRIVAFGLTEGDRLIGYTVARIDQRGGRILDLVTRERDAEAGAHLLDRAVTHLRGAGCRSVECLLPGGHREEAALRAAGFLRSGEERMLQVTRTRHARTPAILEVMEDQSLPIHVTAGDFDHG